MEHDDQQPLFSSLGRELSQPTHNARPNTLTGRIREAVTPAQGNRAHRDRDVSLGAQKQSGARNEADAPLVSAGMIGESLTQGMWWVWVLSAVGITLLAAVYTGFIFHQRHKINGLVAQVSLQQLVLSDAETGFVCAHCDTATGDIIVDAGTVFLGAGSVALMPDTYTDDCMTCSAASGIGADLHRAVPLMQDDDIPLDTDGQTVYPYGHTFQTATGPLEDGSEPRAPYFLRTNDLTVGAGIISMARFAMGQTCAGASCSVTYDSTYTDAPGATPSTGFPDVCSGTTDASIPENSLYFIHRDMASTVLFVDGMTELGDVIFNGQGTTFVHLCTCVVSPATTDRTQYCTSPFVGATQGDFFTDGLPVAV